MAVAVGGQSNFDITDLVGLPPNLEGGFTVIRMIGTLAMTGQGANAAIGGHLGIATLTRDGFAGGNAPDPAVALVDWYYLTHQAMAAPGTDIKASIQVPFDIRSARAIRGVDRTLAAMFKNDPAPATIVELSLSFRLLLRHR